MSDCQNRKSKDGICDYQYVFLVTPLIVIQLLSSLLSE